MLQHYKDRTTPLGSQAKKEDGDLIERGVFVDVDQPEYCREYEKIIERAGGRS
jgi:2-oxoglutarate ferredoxin oxidoreductase subunit beta